MNAQESALEYPFGDAVPASGAVLQIAPGVYWLRMGLPFALNHINLWLLEDELTDEHGRRRGWTIIDCGIADAASRAGWEAIFASHLQGLPILRVLATHCHPDHVGLAGWLCARWQAPLWMTAGEYAFARMMSAALPGADGASILAHFQRHGLTDPVLIAKAAQRKNYFPSLVPEMPHAFTRIQDGQRLRIGAHNWRVITGFGHAPEHAALYCAELELLISGDMILPRISTNVAVFAIEPDGNPLQQYLDSLDKYAELPDEAQVLPSHGKPFRRLHARIRQLREHHRARLDEVRAACATARSAADIVPIMFPRSLDTHQLTFALGEALAHLHKLWYDGELKRIIGADGVVRFMVT